jgi:hypothetical protein
MEACVELMGNSMGAWQPITRTEFDELLAEQVGMLSDESRERYEQYHVPLWQATIRRSEVGGDELVWVVAQYNNLVVVFDDVEYEFASGFINDDGQLVDDIGLVGELTHAMFEFPERYGDHQAE